MGEGHGTAVLTCEDSPSYPASLRCGLRSSEALHLVHPIACSGLACPHRPPVRGVRGLRRDRGSVFDVRRCWRCSGFLGLARASARGGRTDTEVGHCARTRGTRVQEVLSILSSVQRVRRASGRARRGPRAGEAGGPHCPVGLFLVRSAAAGRGSRYPLAFRRGLRERCGPARAGNAARVANKKRDPALTPYNLGRLGILCPLSLRNSYKVNNPAHCFTR